MRCFESVEGMTSRSRDWDRRDWITDGTGTINLRVVSILSIGIISPAFHTLIGERARGVEPERKVCNRPCDAVVTDVDKVIMHEGLPRELAIKRMIDEERWMQEHREELEISSQQLFDDMFGG